MKITVIGAGPGGYEAALYAAKKGAQVTLIEKDSLGGTCLNRGCIPTKAFLASSEVFESAQEAAEFGVKINGEITVDYAEIVERKNKVVAGLVKGVQFLMDKAKVKVINGFGSFKDAKTVLVTKADGTEETVESDAVILATGSVPIAPGMFKYDGKRVITSDEVLDMKSAPASLILVGGGVIGCEIGQFLAAMGTEVTIVEMQSQILPTMDEDVSRQLARQFKKDKIAVITGDGIAEVNPAEDSVSVKLSSGKELTADYVLVAIGRAPFTKGLNAEAAGIEIDQRGRVVVDDFLQTTAPGIYAIGDLLNSAQLAHVAAKEAFVAVDNIFGASKKPTYHAVPGCIFTNPEIASAGLTEAELTKAETPYKKGVFDLRALGKAQASGKLTGFVKVLTDEEGTLIGAAIVGVHATDMLQVLTTAIQLKLKAEDVAESIFPHPTMCEGIMEALHDLHGMSVHKV